MAKPTRYATFLFDEDFVISLSLNASKLAYYYSGDNFTFVTRDNTTSHLDSMNLKRNLIQESGGFAIESFPGEPSMDCMNESSDELKHLIVSCDGNLNLRLLTDKERVEIEKYKKDYRSKPLKFEIRT